MTFKEVIIGIDRPLSKLHSLWRHSYFSSAVCASFLKFFLKHNYHHSGFYLGQQCSWTLTPANSMQDSIMQSDDRNRKKLGLRQAFNLPRLRSLGWMGEQIRCQHILVSHFKHFLNYCCSSPFAKVIHATNLILSQDLVPFTLTSLQLFLWPIW